jgi:FAD/FMN-containing dehydrogenase
LNFSTDSPFTILIETSGSSKDHDDEKLSNLLETLMASELITDGVLSESQTHAQQFWAVREGIPVACGKAGAVYKYDVSMPLNVMYDLVKDTEKRLVDMGLFTPEDPSKGVVTSVVGYGHVGDSNLHLNVACPTYTPEVTAALEPFIYEWVSSKNGSISAEHGLGLMKGRMIGYSKPKEMVDVMQAVKSLLDPNGALD